MSSRVAIVALAMLSAGACANVLDLDEYTNEPETGAGGEGGAVVCGTAPIPQGGVCPLECTYCDGTTCIISCETGNACLAETKVCPEGWDCEVYCDGDGSCKSAEVHCAGAHNCKLFCRGGNFACEDVQLFCARGPCVINCQNNLNICGDATVLCGENSCTSLCMAGFTPPVLNCGAETCQCDRCEAS